LRLRATASRTHRESNVPSFAPRSSTIESINERRLDDFLALFARDATIVDGPTYRGAEAIRAWAQRETFGVQMHIDVVREKNNEGTEVEVEATSTGGYSGPGTFSFAIRGGRITRLEIR